MMNLKMRPPTIYKHPGDEKYSPHLQIQFRDKHGHGYVVAYPSNWKHAFQLYPRMFMRWVRYCL